MDIQSGQVDIFARQTSAIADYIAYGIEHGCGDCIGLELEHFVVRKDNRGYVSFYDDPVDGHPGIKRILEKLLPFYDTPIFETSLDGESNLIGLSRSYAAITLEPGAQFEISIGPVLEIRDLEIVYHAFRREIDPILDEFGYELLELGYHPSKRAQDIPLIPKDRYRFMDEYFTGTGGHGKHMMRATASTQVSIDYDSEADAIQKFRIANALCPLLAFITDNSPVYELEPTKSKELVFAGQPVINRMIRTKIWDDVDACRSMTAPHTFEAGFDFNSYAQTVLSAPAIFSVEHDSAGEQRSIRHYDKTFSEIYADKELDQTAIEHILSLYFFDVRFKTYIEIRAADSLPIEYALSYAAFLKGLFFDKATVTALGAMFKGLSAEDIVSAKLELQNHAFEATVYGRKAVDWLDELVTLSRASLPSFEQDYLDALEELITSRTTLIDQ